MEPSASDASYAADTPSTPRGVALAGLRGRTLRYAEVIPEATGPGRIRRLGTCDFDADAEAALLGPEGTPHLDVLARALADVFDGAPLESLVVAAHPNRTVSFFTPLPDGLAPEARYAQLRQEAALLADVPAHLPVRIRAVPVRTETIGGAPHRWHHALHVPEHVHDRLTLLAQTLGVASYDLSDTTQGTAALVRALAPPATPDAAADPPPLVLAVGAYAQHTEYALCRGTEWLHGHYGPSAAPEDTAYFALALLERLGLAPSALETLYAYGDELSEERLGLLAEFLDRPAQPLDPFALFARRPEGVAPETLAAFAPVLGAALR
ncbi:MAG: hypothetical protein ACK41D_00600 [Rubricoccaceae bacterium]